MLFEVQLETASVGLRMDTSIIAETAQARSPVSPCVSLYLPVSAYIDHRRDGAGVLDAQPAP